MASAYFDTSGEVREGLQVAQSCGAVRAGHCLLQFLVEAVVDGAVREDLQQR